MPINSDQGNESGNALRALLYVSRVAIDADQQAAALADIQTVSVARNTASDITGLLIATPSHFAQLLEGPRASIDAVMRAILNDPRHRDIRVVRNMPIARRLGDSWRLLSFDSGSFEERHVTPVLERAHSRQDDASTAALMGLVSRLVASRSEASG
jgi:hypothetical protein